MRVSRAGEGVGDAAANAGCSGVAREDAVADRNRAADAVEDAAAVGSRVAREGDVADCNRAAVEDAAAEEGGTVADGYVLDRRRDADANSKHAPAYASAVDGRIGGALALDRQVSVDCNVRFVVRGVLDADGIARACRRYGCRNRGVTAAACADRPRCCCVAGREGRQAEPNQGQQQDYHRPQGIRV